MRKKYRTHVEVQRSAVRNIQPAIELLNESTMQFPEGFKDIVIDIFKKEGVVLDAYLDSAGYPSIAVGNRNYLDGSEPKPGDTVSLPEAVALGISKAQEFSETVKDAVKNPITMNQLQALTSFAYNIGPSAFRKSSVLKRLNQGDYRGAADRMLEYDNVTDQRTGELRASTQLYSRRRDERALFLKEPSEDQAQGNVGSEAAPRPGFSESVFDQPASEPANEPTNEPSRTEDRPAVRLFGSVLDTLKNTFMPGLNRPVGMGDVAQGEDSMALDGEEDESIFYDDSVAMNMFGMPFEEAINAGTNGQQQSTVPPVVQT